MKKERKLKKIYIIIPIVIIFLILGIIAGPVYSMYFSEKTMYNLKIGNLDAGNKTKEQLETLLLKNQETEKKVGISWENSEFEIDLNSICNVDIEKTVNSAVKAGKDNFLSAVKSFYSQTKADFVFTCQEKDFKDNIIATMTELGIFKGSYSVEIEKDTAIFTINENEGNPHTDLLFEEIKSEYPTYDRKFTLQKLSFVWPTASQIKDDFNSPAINAHISEENGQRRIINHKEGREIDFEVLTEKIEAKEKEFKVPFKIIKPEVYTEYLGDENFPVLLGKCVTKYNEGAVGRSHNVKLAASKINGYVMNKGDVFSFNNVVGKRTQATGFKSAPVYSGSGVEDGIGGGICQVSSTLYGAVLEADLKIVSRTNHSYVVSYTKPGLDATVSYGTIDFKFENPFSQPIKIKAEAKGGNMTVYIYGTKQNNNTVVVDYKILSTTPRGVKRVFNPTLELGSEIIKSAGFDGMKVQNYKYIKDENGKIISTQNLGISNYVVLDQVIEYNDGASVTPDIPEGEQPIEDQENVPVVLPTDPIPNETEIPENPTQENLELDPEYSGNAEVNIPVTEEEIKDNKNLESEAEQSESDI